MKMKHASVKRGTTKPHIRMRKLSTVGKTSYSGAGPSVQAFPSAPGAPAFDPSGAPPMMGGPAPAAPAGPGGMPGGPGGAPPGM